MAKNKNKSSKRINTILLMILLPILSLGIGFFGVQIVMDGSVNIIESEEVKSSVKPTAEERESVKEKEINLDESNNKEEEEENLLTFQIPSITTYNVQVGSFSEEANANKMSLNVKKQGFGAYVYGADVYKVFIMSFLDRKSADVNKVISEQIFEGAYITEIKLKPAEIKYSEKDSDYIRELNKGVGVLSEILESYTKYVYTFSLSSFDQDDFSVYLITQHNEITKLKDRISSREVSDELKDQKYKVIKYIESLESLLKKMIDINNPTEKEIWNEMIELIFNYSNIV